MKIGSCLAKYLLSQGYPVGPETELVFASGTEWDGFALYPEGDRSHRLRGIWWYVLHHLVECPSCRGTHKLPLFLERELENWGGLPPEP